MSPLPLRLVLGAAIVMSASSAAAQPTPASAGTIYEYAVKFICGTGDGRVVARGVYFTAINVHNPALGVIALRKKFAVALPSEKSGPISNFFGTRLRPDEALEIECANIREHLRSTATFVTGFAVIQSRTPLDVVAVYTAAGSTQQIQTMEMERVPPRMTTSG
jgi:hypothetical protein